LDCYCYVVMTNGPACRILEFKSHFSFGCPLSQARSSSGIQTSARCFSAFIHICVIFSTKMTKRHLAMIEGGDDPGGDGWDCGVVKQGATIQRDYCAALRAPRCLRRGYLGHKEEAIFRSRRVRVFPRKRGRLRGCHLRHRAGRRFQAGVLLYGSCNPESGCFQPRARSL